MSEAEFELKARECGLAKTKHEGLWPAWKFRNEIRVGDIIVANEGTHTVLGYGYVTQSYSYVKDYCVGEGKHSHPHRLEVDWQDRQPREVSEPGWRKTLILLTPERFEVIRNRPVIQETDTAHTTGTSAATPTPRELPELREVPSYTCAQAKQLELIGYLRELFQQKTTHVFARRLNAAAGQTRLQTLFAEFFARWPDRDVAWALKFKATDFLSDQCGLPASEVTARLAASPADTALGALFAPASG